MRLKLLAAICLLPLAACGKHGSAPVTEGVTDAMIAAAPEGEWLTYGRDLAEQRFSPLTLINDANVGQLGLAWSHDLETARGQEATPLMHDGVLYVSTAWSMVKAFDAKTGALKWEYDPKVPRETLVRACCDAVNRGVALYGDKVYVGTLDGRLVALDQKTGKVAFEKVVVPNQKDYTITGAPRVAKGKILIGAGGSEYKARGYLAAYDAQTGDELWKFHTVPGNPADGFENKAMEAAAKTWGNSKWWELGGGGTVWDSITYDPATNLVYFGTGNAEPWNPAANGREGDSLYTSSIVAVDADTGEYKWHFQETPEDRWDFDSDAQITAADLDVNGQKRRVVLHAPKNGYFYMLDAKSGQFISAGAFAPQTWTTGIDPKTGRPQINPEAKYEKTGKPFLSVPGAGGAHSWQPMSFSQKTGLVYIPANLAAMPYAAAKDWKPSDIGFQTGMDGALVAAPADKAAREGAKAATTGALIAWDPVKQKEAWRAEYVAPWNGGTLTTQVKEHGRLDAAETGRQLGVIVLAGGGVHDVAVPDHQEREVVELVVLPVVDAVAVVRVATVLEHADEGFLLRETEHPAGVDRGVLRQVHVGVVPGVVGLAVATLVGSGHRHTHLAVRAEHGVVVVDVPELDDVVLEVKAVGEHATKGLLVAAVEEG